MDLGIRGKSALVCASSRGLGLGCAEALAEAGVNLTMNARGSEQLEASAAAVREKYGIAVNAVAADIASEDGRKKCWKGAARSTFSSATLAGRRRERGQTGTAEISSRLWNPTC